MKPRRFKNYRKPYVCIKQNARHVSNPLLQGPVALGVINLLGSDFFVRQRFEIYLGDQMNEKDARDESQAIRSRRYGSADERAKLSAPHAAVSLASLISSSGRSTVVFILCPFSHVPSFQFNVNYQQLAISTATRPNLQMSQPALRPLPRRNARQMSRAVR